MNMHKAVHPNDDIDSLYVWRKTRKKNTSTEDSVDTSIQGLEDNIRRSEEKLTVANNSIGKIRPDRNIKKTTAWRFKRRANLDMTTKRETLRKKVNLF